MSDNSVYVANNVEIRIFKGQTFNHQVLYTFGSDEKFIKLLKSGDSAENIYIVYQSKENTCVKIIGNGELKDKIVC